MEMDSMLFALVFNNIMLILIYLKLQKQKNEVHIQSPEFSGKVVQTPSGTFSVENGKRRPVVNTDENLWKAENRQ